MEFINGTEVKSGDEVIPVYLHLNDCDVRITGWWEKVYATGPDYIKTRNIIMHQQYGDLERRTFIRKVEA